MDDDDATMEVTVTRSLGDDKVMVGWSSSKASPLGGWVQATA